MFLRFSCSLRPKFVSSSSQNGTLPLRIDMHSGAGKLYCAFIQSPARIYFQLPEWKPACEDGHAFWGGKLAILGFGT